MSARRLQHYKLLRGRRDIINITVSSKSEEYSSLIRMINMPDLFSTDVLDLKETRYKRVSLCLMKVIYKWKINDQLVKKEDQHCGKAFHFSRCITRHFFEVRFRDSRQYSASPSSPDTKNLSFIVLTSQFPRAVVIRPKSTGRLEPRRAARSDSTVLELFEVLITTQKHFATVDTSQYKGSD